MEVQRRRHRGGRRRTEKRRKSILHIVNIDENVSDHEIKNIMGRYGQVAWCQRLSNSSPRQVFVRFTNQRYCLF